MTETVGCFHYNQMVNGLPRTLKDWRVTAGRRDCADQVLRLLGGRVTEIQEGSAIWEVLTTATVVKIVVESADEMALSFRLADDWRLGVFEFRSVAWNIGELLGSSLSQLSTLDGPGVCELGIGSVIVKTLGGRQVRFRCPSLLVIGPWARSK